MEQPTNERTRVHSYKDLIVWQKSMDLVTSIYTLTENFPQHEKEGLTANVRNAATMVPTNIADGWGRKSSKYYSQAVSKARGSLCELETLLMIAEALHYTDSIEEYSNEIVQISKMLNGLLKSISLKAEQLVTE